jgi:hypothetical protein
MKKILPVILIGLGLHFAAGSEPSEACLQFDGPFHVHSRDGFFDLKLSGLFDLEGYFVDQRPGGLIFGGGDAFVNPRLSLFLDAQFGKHFYSFVQARVDRGFDPRVKKQDARFDEYFLRYTPFDDARVNFQFGKFATVVGNWVPRHDSWHNPFITAPLPYENVTVMGDQAAAPTAASFLARQKGADKKAKWLPMIWGPAYTSGGSVFGSIDKFDYALEFKNASISSRPSVWDARDLDWENPTVSARFGFRPNASWNIGISESFGAFYLPKALPTLPPGKDLQDYNQFTLGQDISYAHGHWQFWGEIFVTRWQTEVVGNADVLAYYLEAKYKFTPQLFGALRWNQELFGKVRNSLGGESAWDKDIWRIDAAVGYRLNRHLQGKVQYSYNEQRGPLQEGEQLVAAQITLKF